MNKIARTVLNLIAITGAVTGFVAAQDAGAAADAGRYWSPLGLMHFSPDAAAEVTPVCVLVGIVFLVLLVAGIAADRAAARRTTT